MPRINDHKRSVKKEELAQPYVFWFPHDRAGALPPQLPNKPLNPILGLHSNERDEVLISTVHHESMWAGAIRIQASRFAVAGWRIDGDKPRIQAMFQEILLNSTVGIVKSYVSFAAAGMASFANTGKWIVEIERYTSNSGSRIKAFHHLDPSRCWITTDPERPVYYIDRLGAAHEMRDYQVMILMDIPDLQEYAINSPDSAGVCAYPKIVQLAALEQYIYEKVSGRRPLAIHFIQGLANSSLIDTLNKGQAEADEKGYVSYMGALMAGIMGDTPLNLVTIPLAEIPDGINAEEVRQSAHLVYANSLGDDPAGIDPKLIGNRQLGAGTQAVVLDERASRGGIVNVLMKQWTHGVNERLSEQKIQFAFIEKDLRDQRQSAEVSSIRANTRKVQVEIGEITPEQATNLAVDADDLPKEFLKQDATEAVAISDEENAEMSIDSQEDGQNEEVEETEEEPTEEAMKALKERQRKTAFELIESTKPDAKLAYNKAKRYE